MQRIEPNMRRYPAGTLVSAHDFTSRGALDDLKYLRAGSSAYIAAGSATAGERLVLHTGPDAFLDQAVECVIDRSMPRRSAGGNDPIGLIIAWQTSGLGTPVTECSGYSASGVPAIGELIDDDALGEDNHVRVVIAGDDLIITERREAADGSVTVTELFRMTLSDAHRRIALRAALVDGQLVLWWNPYGRRWFEEPPLARVHVLIDGLGKMGLICGRDGRFLEATFEYRTAALSQASVIGDVTEAGVALVPVRLTLTADDSRPAMYVGIVVEHADDTRLPERQERVSRVYLRDARVMLRPGHSYRAFAYLRTVDDQDLVVECRPFVVPGDAEDLALRDCLGRQFGAVTDGLEETLSDIDVLVWPETLEEGKVRTSAAPGLADAITTSDVTDRGIRRSSLAPRRFEFGLDLDDTTRETIRAFLAEAQGRVRPFLWTHPITGEHIVCRFARADLGVKGVENEVYRAGIELVEEPRCLDRDVALPSAPGYSNVTPAAIPPGQGACCLDGGGCVTTTRANCDMLGGEYNGDGSRCDQVECDDPGGGFNCEVDCGDECFEAQHPLLCGFCPQTSGISGAPLCGCQIKEIGVCRQACLGNTCGGGTGQILREIWCCFESGKELLSSDTGGLSVHAYCCLAGAGCSKTLNESTCGYNDQCCNTAPL